MTNKTILLTTVLAVTILGLTSASMVFNNTVEADNGEAIFELCIGKTAVFDPNTGVCIPIDDCPNGVSIDEIISPEGGKIIINPPHCALISDERTPVRDNVDVENIKLKEGQWRVIVDNAGIGATSDVEITWNFEEKNCVVIAAGTLSTGFGTVALVDDNAFGSLGIPVGHNDVKLAEAILLTVAPDAKKCVIDSDKGEFVAVSTVAMGPKGLMVTSNP